MRCTPVQNFSQFGELLFSGPNLPKNTLECGVLGQKQPENNLF